jgi:uncharacterized protein (TIGR04222 family)
MESFSSREFLIVYAVWCLLVLVLARWFAASGDDSLTAPRAALSSALDPWEIAFVRGDANELIRFAVFDLVRAGALEIVPRDKRTPTRLKRTGTPVDLAALSPAARIVYAAIDQPRATDELFRTELRTQVSDAYASERDRLVERGLLAPPTVRANARTARIFGAIALAAPAAFRLWYAAVQHHRNVGFLIVIAIASLVLLLAVTRSGRLSKRGSAYVKSLRATLPKPAPRGPAPSPAALSLLVAAGGMGVLAGTPYAALAVSMRRTGTADGSSSSCSSGSSCSGGCGGGGCGG